MLKDSAIPLTGNERFEGFGIDIIQELSNMLGFKYIFKLQEDGAYGTLNNATGEWNGMIRELREGVSVPEPTSKRMPVFIINDCLAACRSGDHGSNNYFGTRKWSRLYNALYESRLYCVQITCLT